jgi:hypothetical protein
MTTLQSSAPTFDDVWRTIQELALMSKETDRKFDDHLEQISKFKVDFPRFSKFCVFGAVVATVISDEVGEYAVRKGLFVLAQSGDAVKILNDDAFKPQQW